MNKKDYVKPQITRVALLPEEAVLTGCKLASAKTTRGCVHANCGGTPTNGT
jgi:hypothetical protein